MGGRNIDARAQYFYMATFNSPAMVWELIVNDDGSIDIYFGSEAPAGKEANWIQTVPGKGWFSLLRLYSPTEAWYKKTWRPGEIELAE